MPHWRTMMDEKEYLFAFDLDGRDVSLTIDKVTRGEIVGNQGKKNKKPVITFVGAKKKLALCTTNCKTLEQLYGSETNDWEGKRITVYPTTTPFGGEVVPCIRIRPVIPSAPVKKEQA